MVAGEQSYITRALLQKLPTSPKSAWGIADHGAGAAKPRKSQASKGWKGTHPGPRHNQVSITGGRTATGMGVHVLPAPISGTCLPFGRGSGCPEEILIVTRGSECSETSTTLELIVTKLSGKSRGLAARTGRLSPSANPTCEGPLRRETRGGKH